MMEYDFEKLEYRIFSMEQDLEKHYEKLHRALQESRDEIRYCFFNQKVIIYFIPLNDVFFLMLHKFIILYVFIGYM